MADETKPKIESLKAVPKGALALLKKELSTGKSEETFRVYGHEWKLRVINEDANAWAMMFARPVNAVSLLQSIKAPKLACAIVELDGVPVTDLWEYPADMEAERKKVLDTNPLEKRYWVWGQTAMYLAELEPAIVNDLYGKYSELEDKRGEALKAIPS